MLINLCVLAKPVRPWNIGQLVLNIGVAGNAQRRLYRQHACKKYSLVRRLHRRLEIRVKRYSCPLNNL